ncbi:hypothetical protein ABIB25_002000 [Nakamurella sp. UYEF19]|uniref:hypothetical protein n=1 Tax=Nakamurella sp. UYEF19 TaxID=1756392 RepID=UPI003399F1DD
MTTPPEHPAHPAVGPLADEAAQLLDAVAARLSTMRARPVATSAEPPLAPTETTPQDRPGELHPCLGWCPICRGAELMRGDRSEVTEKLLDTALLVVTTLRSLIPEQPAAPEASGPDDTNPPAPSGVERIDIR